MAVGGERPGFNAGEESVRKRELGVLTSCVFSAISLFYVVQIALYSSQLDFKYSSVLCLSPPGHPNVNL